jgi:hypothetical protein
MNFDDIDKALDIEPTTVKSDFTQLSRRVKKRLMEF